MKKKAHPDQPLCSARADEKMPQMKVYIIRMMTYSVGMVDRFMVGIHYIAQQAARYYLNCQIIFDSCTFIFGRIRRG